MQFQCLFFIYKMKWVYKNVSFPHHNIPGVQRGQLKMQP